MITLSVGDGSVNQVFNKTIYILTIDIIARVRCIRLGVGSVGQFVRLGLGISRP